MASWAGAWWGLRGPCPQSQALLAWQLLEGDWTMAEPSCPLCPMRVVLKGGRETSSDLRRAGPLSVACSQPHGQEEAPTPGPTAVLRAAHSGDGPKGHGGLGNAGREAGDRLALLPAPRRRVPWNLSAGR